MIKKYKIESPDISDLEIQNLIGRFDDLSIDKIEQDTGRKLVWVSGETDLMPRQVEMGLESMRPEEFAVMQATKSPFDYEFPEGQNLNTGTVDIGNQGEDDHFDIKKINTWLDKMNQKVKSQPSDIEVNIESGKTSFVEYLKGIQKELEHMYQFNSDKAQKVIKDTIEKLVNIGELPELPNEDTDMGDISYSEWMAKAKAFGLKGVIVKNI